MEKIVRLSFLLMVFGLLSKPGFSQNNILVSGQLKDTVGYMSMMYSSITVIKASDSQLVTFGRADEEGKFSIDMPGPDQYIFMFVHPMMATYNTTQDVSASGLEFGDIMMTSKSYILEELVVIGKRAITIKGDTTEYTADSFKVREFDNVEALLKKLPGLEVDDKGNITAHGEKVQKMLVDGDEFFSDDPAVLSKMLRASAVDKVQVFDGKTENAQFTGIDDGERIKTINLELKEDAKSGHFGKIELGGGLPEYWENQGMINFFKDKRKISAFAIMSNTNKIGLGWEDNSNYGSGSDISFDEESGSMISEYTSTDNEGFGSFDGSFQGRGLPKTINGGLHYGDKYGKDNQHELTADYRINSNNLDAFNHTRNQYNFADTQYINVSREESFSSSLSNNLASKAKIFIDSTSDITIRMSGNMTNRHSESSNNSYYADIHENKINESNTLRNAETNSLSGMFDLNYRKKFKKKGRTIIGTFKGNYRQSYSEGNFNSTNSFFSTGTDLVYNQIKADSSINTTLNAKVTYTEPLTEKIFLVTNAYTSINNSSATRITYDRTGSADTVNDLFSSDYDFKVWTNSAGANLRFDLEKYTFSFGGNVAHTDFLQTDLFTNTDRPYSFVNFFPSASFRKTRNQTGNFSITYNGATRQPTINQLQPIVVNNDPLNITLGNPDLKQEFRHSVNLNYGKYELLKDQYMYLGGGFNYVDNAISTEQNIDESGVRTYRSINVAGNFNGFLWAGFSRKIKSINSRFSTNLNGGYNRNITILNNVNTVTTNYNAGLDFSLDYNKDTTLYFNISLRPDYNTNFTNTSDIITDFFSLRTVTNFSYTVYKGITVGTDINWYIREKTTPQDVNNNIFLWNAYVSKAFLQDRSLVVKLSGNDMLNQNVGFQRFTYNNMVTESQYNNIRRYFMLSVGWNFTRSNAVDKRTKEDPNEVENADLDPDAYTE